jgi:hypothetical protein
MDSVSWVLILDMLNERKKFIAECNRLWGTSWSVQLAEPWASEYERFMLRNEIMKEGAENGKSVDNAGNGSPDSGNGDKPSGDGEQ